MLVIRLARTGRTKYPTYRIVAAESARAATGKFVALLGHYNPHTKELVMKREETVRYIGNGAQPSNSVIKLLQKEGVELPDWVKLKTKAPKPKEEVKEEVKAEAAPAEAEEAAAEPEVAAEPEAEPVVEEEARVGEVAEAAATEREDRAESAEQQQTAASEDESTEKAKAADAVAEEAAQAEAEPAADSDAS